MARAASILRHVDTMERALKAANFPAMSAWWREQLTRFYSSNCRQIVLRVGRRGGKSSTLCRVAVLEALFGEHKVPPGDVGIVGIVSVSLDQAKERLRTIKALLDALRVKYRTIDGGIELENRRVAFKVFAATLGGVVGGTWICAICDEIATWKDRDTGANPATEVLASLRPTLATQPNARIFLSSSPRGTEDAHAKAFAAGDSDFQLVAQAATWVAHPELTEAETRSLEDNERIWLREYGAIPSDSEVALFSASAVEACMTNLAGFVPLGIDDSPVGLFDGSMGRLDAATWAVARWARPSGDEQPKHVWLSLTARGLVREDELRDDDKILHFRAAIAQGADGEYIPNPKAGWRPPPRLAVWGFGALEGKFAAHTSFDEMVAKASATYKANRVYDVFGDSYMAYALEPAFKKHGLRYVPLVWSNESKSRAVLRLRQYFRDKIVALESCEEADRLKSELLAFKEKVLPSGALSYGARTGSHDDRVALLLNLAMADTDEMLRGSPIRTPGTRHELAPLARTE